MIVPTATLRESRRKLAELKRKLERVELEKMEMGRKLETVERKLDEVEVKRKQGEKSIISCLHIVDGSDVYI